MFDELREADEEQLTLAREYLDGIKAGGGTAIEEALLQAVSYAEDRADSDRPYQVIFLTDGRPTIGETRADKILERLDEKVGDARVFCFGIGTDINTKLLDLVAEKTRAVTEYVLPEEDIEHKVSRFYSKIAMPVMANLKLSVKGGGVRLSERYPKDLPDLFKGDQLVVFGRYKKGEKGKVKVQLEGSLAGERRTFNYKVKLGGSRDHEFIPRMWATRRVGYLLDEIRLRGESAELRDEVVKLARKYGIVTPYTSYLIVEDEEARRVPAVRRSFGRERGADSPMAETKRAYEALADQDSGAGAVAAARASSALKKAKTMSAPADASKEAEFGAAGESGGGEVSRLIAGKSFYLNAEEWIDSEVQGVVGEEVVEIEFGSEEYFELLGRSEEVARWLSVGVGLRVVIEGKVYRIVAP